MFATRQNVDIELEVDVDWKLYRMSRSQYVLEVGLDKSQLSKVQTMQFTILLGDGFHNSWQQNPLDVKPRFYQDNVQKYSVGPKKLVSCRQSGPCQQSSVECSEQCKRWALYYMQAKCIVRSEITVHCKPSAKCRMQASTSCTESINTLLQSRENVRNASRRLDREQSNFHLLTEY